MDPVQEVQLAFSDGKWRGGVVSTLPYAENYTYTQEEVFHLESNSDTFPLSVNGVKGRGSGVKVWRQSDITINAKYYETVVITRYQKLINGTLTFLFHAKPYKVKGTAKSVVKKLKREVSKSPQEYILSVPTFADIDPTSFAISHGKRELIRITGERLKASSGRLENTGSSTRPSDTIFLYISNAVDRRQISAEFNQPDDLKASEYVLYLVIYDNVYKFDTSEHTVKFIDEFEHLTKTLFATVGHLDPIPNPELSFFLDPSPSPLSLTQAIELGNTRCVAMLSKYYPDGQLPVITVEGNEEQARLDLPVVLARKSGNLATLLYVMVWKEVSEGKRPYDALDKMRNYVLFAKDFSVSGMLLSFADPKEDARKLEAIESTLLSHMRKNQSDKELSNIKMEHPSLSLANPVEYAHQLTLVEHELLKSVDDAEWLEQTKEPRKTGNIAAIIQHFNSVASWVATEIVTLPQIADRAMQIENFIKMAVELRRINNFNGLMKIITGLSTSSVARLKHTWKEVRNNRDYEELQALMSAESSFKEYRSAIQKATRPCLPFIGVQLMDLRFIMEGNKDNEGKIESLSSMVIGDLKMYQASSFNFPVNQNIRHILSNLKFMQDAMLYDLSLRIEPRGWEGPSPASKSASEKTESKSQREFINSLNQTPNLSTMSESEKKAYDKYGRLPKPSEILRKRDKKYFDSADWASGADTEK